MDTTWPVPASIASIASSSRASSISRPTSGERARGDAASRRERIGTAPLISCTSTGACRPRTGTGPRERVATRPRTSATVCSVARIEAGLAICSMRAARCTVWPTAV